MNASTIATRFGRVREELAAHARACGRNADDIDVLVVTKQQSTVAIIEAIAAGATQIGESYVQEARTKFADLPAVRRHYIGHIQTNKAKALVELFDCVQSVDRLDAITALERAAMAAGKRLSVLLQVNISPSDRFGCAPAEVESLAEAVRASTSLACDGIMAIGPTDPAAVSGAFALAAACFAQVGGRTLSLGMSGDWREAVAAGSTMIRLGTAIFGPRIAR